MRILKVINDELIDIREFRNANATFNTAEYRKSDDICIYHEQFNPFDLYSDYQKQQAEISRLNNIINCIDNFVDRTIEVIKQQPSGDDEWILERLNGIKDLTGLKENNKDAC